VRTLTSDEARSDDRPAKAIQNAADVVITRSGGWTTDDGWLLDESGTKCFKVDKAMWQRCQRKRKQNAGTQKGVPRCHEPNKYPLAGLCRCAHCGSVMHGIPASGTLRYTCGKYINSGGRKCEHNWLKQDDLLPDVLHTIRESVLPKEQELRVILKRLVGEMNSKPSQDALKSTTALKQWQQSIVENALKAVATAQDDGARWIAQNLSRRTCEADGNRSSADVKYSSGSPGIGLG
jgi:hypothetical protein